MASRFWTQGGSDSEEEENDYDEENENEARGETVTQATLNNYYLHGNASDNDDSDGQKRVVRFAKDKRFWEIASIVYQMKNTVKINDWVSLQERFDKINKHFEKVMRVTETEKVLNLYIKALVMLEDFLAQALTNKDAKKNLIVILTNR